MASFSTRTPTVLLKPSRASIMQSSMARPYLLDPLFLPRYELD